MLLGFISNAFAGEKEYLLQKCNGKSHVSICEGCEVIGKVKFKVSKQLASIMKIISIEKDGRTFSAPYTINNCQIFDDDNWVCKEDGESIKLPGRFLAGSHEENTLSNGIYTNHYSSGIIYGKHNEIINMGTDIYYCATKINGFIDWFK